MEWLKEQTPQKERDRNASDALKRQDSDLVEVVQEGHESQQEVVVQPEDKAKLEQAVRKAVTYIIHGGPSKSRLVELHPDKFNDLLRRRGYQLPDDKDQKLLGKGSYGTVNRIRSASDDTLFALKRQCLGTYAKNSAPVLREITILNKLKGRKSILQIRDAFLEVPGDQAAEIWIVLDHFPGDLRSQRSFFTKENMAKHAAFKLLEGLRVLHRQDIIHRDLKPQNVLVELGENGESLLRLAICDFGMARSIHNVPKKGQPAVPEVGHTVSFGPEEFSLASCIVAICSSWSKASKRSTSTGVQLPVLTRDVTTKVTTSWWRAPEMWDFVNMKCIGREQLKALDIFGFGLMWAELLADKPVLKSVDCKDPQILRLFEILQKVDCPEAADECRGLGYIPDICGFVDLVRSHKYDRVKAKLKMCREWERGNQKQEELSSLKRTGICQWISDHAAKLIPGTGVHEVIRSATRFNYSMRATVDKLLQHEYFQELNGDIEDDPVHHIDDVAPTLEKIDAKQKHANRNRSEPMARKSVDEHMNLMQEQIGITQSRGALSARSSASSESSRRFSTASAA